MGRLSWATWLYVAAVVAAAAAILAQVPPPDAKNGFWVVCAALAALFLICDSTPTVLGDRQWAWSPSSAATLAAVVLLGPDGGIGAAMVGTVAVFSVRRHVPLVERLFNGAMYAIAGYAAGATFIAMPGTNVLFQLEHVGPVLHGMNAIRPVTTPDEDPGRIRVDALFQNTYPESGLTHLELFGKRDRGFRTGFAYVDVHVTGVREFVAHIFARLGRRDQLHPGTDLYGEGK